MSYFTNRHRAYSKPTKEETKELNHHLSKCSPHELRLIILSAANESSDVARLLTKVMKDSNLIPQPCLRPVQADQWHMIANLTAFNTGLPTPIDASDDSEMSGTENIQPELQNYHSTQAEPCALISPYPASDNFHSGTTPPKRSNKRKSLADRDDNIPSFGCSPRPQAFAKRRKPSIHSAETTSHPDKIHCVNCGIWTSDSEFENLHSCIYHPGTFELDDKVCSWSCCRNADLKSLGCLITRHKGSTQDTWLFEPDAPGRFHGTHEQRIDAASGGDSGQMSQYARLISIKG